ncbi:Sec-independent protein translocase subunit TatA/TatB [Microlunatus soli]|uniref:Sec-independent protein translocase protein TatA n=1 Tax=Microlunatus soli TaxID=630515 RepID=A0A1H1Z658_9ACTN|nr:sec-independent protein translocase protein TatA [Microlunatus soli]
MAPLALDIGPSELLIILAVVLVLFGGSRLAGLGKSAGRAIKEFKDETGIPDSSTTADLAERPAVPAEHPAVPAERSADTGQRPTR